MRVSTLAYVIDARQTHALMVHRVFHNDDPHFGRVNGLGGKLEPGENIADCVIRELREEADIEVQVLQPRGTVIWTGILANGEEELAFIFLVSKYKGDVRACNDEGCLRWESIDRLSDLNLWPGDGLLLPLIFDTRIEQFHAMLTYVRGRVESFNATTTPSLTTIQWGTVQ